MPAKSQEQKKLMQMALAYKEGELDTSDMDDDFVEKIKGIASDMSKEELEKYAKSEVEEKVRKVVRNEIQSLLSEDHLDGRGKRKLNRILKTMADRVSSLYPFSEEAKVAYGDDGEFSFAVINTLSSIQESSGKIENKLYKIHRNLKEEYPDFDWDFVDELKKY